MDFSNVDIRDAFFDEIYKIAAKDEEVVFITADADAFSLRKYKKDFSNRFINVGVAEQNMVNVASGLALSGKKVYIYSIIPFLTMRCYEQIKANICSMNLPVTIIGAGAGLSFGNDGPTHHAIQDIGIMRVLPEITILNPSDSALAYKCAHMSYKSKTPVYVRIDKGTFPQLHDFKDNIKKGFKVIKEVEDITIISTGYMSHIGLKAAEELEKQSIKVGLIDLFMLKPLEKKLLLEQISKTKKIISIEENSIIGGLGTILSELLCEYNKKIDLIKLGLKDMQYFEYGTRDWFLDKDGLNKEKIIKTILNEVKYA